MYFTYEGLSVEEDINCNSKRHYGFLRNGHELRVDPLVKKGEGK